MQKLQIDKEVINAAIFLLAKIYIFQRKTEWQYWQAKGTVEIIKFLESNIQKINLDLRCG